MGVNETEALSIITQRLQPGETLVWYGVPRPLSAAADYFLPLAFLTLGIIAVARGLTAANASDWHSPNPGVLTVLLFLLGLWLWTGKKAADCWRTAYGLTNLRIIIAIGANGPAASYDAAALADMRRTGNEFDGSILFDYGWLPLWRCSGLRGYRSGLYGMRNPGRVEALIYEILLDSKKGAAQ